MTDKVGEKYVRFFSAGFNAENGDNSDKAQYEDEVLTLANNTISQNNIIAPINDYTHKPEAILLMKSLIDSLYRNRVLCKVQCKYYGILSNFYL